MEKIKGSLHGMLPDTIIAEQIKWDKQLFVKNIAAEEFNVSIDKLTNDEGNETNK